MRPFFVMGTLNDLFVRGSVALSDGLKKMRQLQVRLLANEIRDDLEHVEPYGFTSEPKDDGKPEAFALFFDGDKSHGVVICVADRRYRITDLKPGEVAIYDDLGQYVFLKRTGIFINTPKDLTATVQGTCSVTAHGGLNLTAPTVTINADTTNISGDLIVGGKVDSPDVISNGIAFNSHGHTNVENGPDTSGGPV